MSAEPVFGNILMRKVIGAELGENNFGLDREETRNSSSSVIVSEGFGSTDVSRDRDCLDVNDDGIPSKLDESERRRPGPSVGALLKELGGQAVVFLVAALGISALLAPFGGPSLLSEISGDGLGVLPSALFGSTVGLGSVAIRRIAQTGTISPVPVGRFAEFGDLFVEKCRQDASFKRQKSVSTRVIGFGGGVWGGWIPSLATVVVWQLSVAIAEELYYRGFLQSGLRFAMVGGAGSPAVVGDLISICVASALFGLAHTQWVETTPGDGMVGEEGTDDGSGDRLSWFRTTGLGALLYGATFIASGYNIAAPVFTHFSQNLWYMTEELTALRMTKVEILEELFDEDEGN